ncbi:SAVED domain-containing protein [Bacillus sp. FJAT-29790]|uniref:SAVED domain-containing protein n=1 Tax=Bacillus sp. FJAT-29790 TaxID=1895002 RepID=UPI001C229FAB|nr:SAVED domain-containing protein [Bacillus sp. FJAT-29790]MBU8880104.1 SAVED domain-containing protein [Bacillus sp. FJAT-29790]
MSKTSIPDRVKNRLWGKAAGRCQYEGCNEPLWMDSLTQWEFNAAYIAHIIADSPNGPRGHETLSEKLAKDISNLMLMCDKHHRLIDREDVEGHPVERLVDMKKKHELRVEMVTSIGEDRKSHVLFYGANIGEHSSPVHWERTTPAMLPQRYPAEKPAIELSIMNSPFRDHQELYWTMESENLRNQFLDKVKRRLELGDIQHLSVFALAPQPLLIELGRLLSDICPADVYQLHREPSDWKWQDDPEGFEYIVEKPEIIHKKVALNLSLSATIDNQRILNTLGDDVSIWNVTIPSPYNDYLKSSNQLRKIRKVFRELLNNIKLVHGHDNIIHVFPAVPVSVAIELGRVWMPKADLPLSLFDEKDGFHHAFTIGERIQLKEVVR